MKTVKLMSLAQQKHLHERLRDAERSKDKRYENIPETEKPFNVRAAERAFKSHSAVINQWRTRIDRVRQSRYKAMLKQSAKVRELILFGTPEKALAALHAFETSAK